MTLSVFEQQVPDPADPRVCRCGRPWQYGTGTFKNTRYLCARCFRRPKIVYKGRRIR